MRKVRRSVIVPICLYAFGATSAGAAYTVLDGGVADGGTISGRVTLDGTPPEPSMLTVDEDVEACGGDRLAENLLVSGAGGIKNVVLSIEGISSGKAWDFSEKFVYDQKNCRFVPHVLLVQLRAPGVVTNSDTVGHNFHTISKGVFNTNKKINADAEMAVQANKIRRPGVVRVKCDIHSWMSGWWFVAETPYAVLTDEDGSFSITGIPAGAYTVKIWHETLGESEQSVVVEANGTTELSVSLGQ
jgi:plastocyanin